MKKQIASDAAMQAFGEQLGRVLHGGALLELVGDVGAGKTTFTKGLARGLEADDDVQSPTFTLSRVYNIRDGGVLVHYDFYRLNEPGIMHHEIAEAIADPETIVVIEWGDIIEGVLPDDRLTIRIVAVSENSREIDIQAGGDSAKQILEQLT